MIRNTLKKCFILILIVGIILLIPLALKTPSHDRDWREDNAELASCLIEGDTVHIDKVRDWRYDKTGPLSKEWQEKEYDLSLIQDVWFILESFSSWDAIGHAMLMFDFSDQQSVLISIEARKEVDQKFSTFKGLIREFDLICLWGTQEDFLVRRALVQEHPLRIHQLSLGQPQAKNLFLSLCNKTNSIKEQPEFYNTLFSNCASELAYAANKSGNIPFTASRILTGYSDKTLFNLNLINTQGTWEDQLEASMSEKIIRENHQNTDWPSKLRKHLLKSKRK